MGAAIDIFPRKCKLTDVGYILPAGLGNPRKGQSDEQIGAKQAHQAIGSPDRIPESCKIVGFKRHGVSEHDREANKYLWIAAMSGWAR